MDELLREMIERTPEIINNVALEICMKEDKIFTVSDYSKEKIKINNLK